MSIRKSIRWKIQAWHGLLLLVMCSGFGVTLYQLQKTNIMRLSDQALESRLGVLTTALSQGGGGGGGGGGGPEGGGRRRPPPPRDGSFEEDGPPRDGPPRGGPREVAFRGEGPPGEGPGPPRKDGLRKPPGFRLASVTSLFETKDPGKSFYYQVWSRRDEAVIDKSSNAPVGLPRPQPPRPHEKTSRIRDGMHEAYVFTPPGECILVGRSMAGIHRELRDFASMLAGIGSGVMGLGLAVGWWIASRALKPISQISAAATRIASGNLKERISTRETESELGRLASLLDDTFQRLDESFEEQARFTSDAAHELRTPVSIILAQSQYALSKERSAEAYRETIEMSQRAARRMHELIESLLQLSILDASEGVKDLQSCDLAEIAREQLQMFAPLAAEKSITLIPDLHPAVCLANPGPIGQILMNLITNAVKFSPRGAEIRVASIVSGGCSLLEVSDNGPGIPAGHLPHLFERFYRVDQSRNRATGGAGLGLSICKRIAEAHGGSLSVASIVGKGSTFTLAIPHET